jgi:short-subunit dehydrogenase
VEHAPAEDLARIVDVNLRAPIVLTRLAIPYLRRAGGGAIVNVASIAGRIPLPEEATYSATKFGLRAFTFALAEELQGSGITVSAVSPGPVETGFILKELEEVPDVVFSQPMSSADDIAKLILECAADGSIERAHPASSAYLATLGYLVPQLPRLLRPLLERRGRAAKQAYLAMRKQA